MFLKKYLGSDGSNSEEWAGEGHRDLADILAKQPTVGTTIKTDAGALGFVSAISLQTHKVFNSFLPHYRFPLALILNFFCSNHCRTLPLLNSLSAASSKKLRANSARL